MYNSDIDRTVSYNAKKKSKFKRQRVIMDMYNRSHRSGGDDKDRMSRIRANYNLLNGIVNQADYNKQDSLRVEGDMVDLGYAKIEHFPLIAKVAEAAIGEEILMPFNITIKDTSPETTNKKRREHRNLLRAYLDEVHINPKRQKLIESELGPGITIDQLPPEQGQQIMNKVEEAVRAMTPEEIKDYIDTEFRSLEQIQGQKLMNYLSEYLQLKRKKNSAFEDAFAIAEEYYLVGTENDEPTFRTLNPAYVEWEPTPGKPWIQDALYALYREDVTVQEAFARDGEYLGKQDAKKIAQLVHGRSSSSPYPGEMDALDEEVLFEVHTNPDRFRDYGNIDLSTVAGQDKMIKVYDEVVQGGNFSYGDMYLTRTYIAWRDMAYFKRVKRRNAENLKEEWFYEAENYVFNPNNGDVEMKKVEKPEIWHGVVYGWGEDGCYIRIEPLPYQRASLKNISNVKLPFFGGKINTRKGNAERNVSNVDFGKKWNYAFDLEMAELRMKQASNIGKVFVMLKEFKPEGMQWGEWVATMKHLKFLLVETTREDMEINPQWASLLQGIDMGNLSDISSAISLLDVYQRNLADSMHFNQERLGRIGQYMTATTSQSAQDASSVQTTRLYDTHNYLFTEAIQALLDVARQAYKHNPPKRGWMMNDLSQADLELDWEMLSRAELGVFASISPLDIQKVQQIKLRTQEMIQNQMLDIEDLFRFEMADTPSELMNLGASISKKRQEAQAAASQQEEARIQQAVEAEFKRFQQEAELKIVLQDKKDASDERAALIQSLQFLKTVDVNENQINDSKEINDDDLRFKREELAKKDEWKKAEVSAKKEDIRARKQTTNK